MQKICPHRDLIPRSLSPTISSELDVQQWMTSQTGQFNQRTEPFNRVLGGPHSLSGHFRVEKNLFSPLGLEPRTIQLVKHAIQIMLPRLQKCNYRTGMRAQPSPHYPLYRSWVGTRASLDWCRKSSAHTRIRSPACTDHSVSLYTRHEVIQVE
jgi:hypothetical protein